MRTFIIWTMLLLLASLSSACASVNVPEVSLPTVADFYRPHEIYERSNLRLGIAPGPYGDMFIKTIFPHLEKLGYTLEVYEFNNFWEPNLSLADGQTDLNIFQHYDFLINFNYENNLDLSAITEIPTLPMSMFSQVYNSLDDIEYGATIIVPNDITNLSRSLRILEFTGLILLAPDVNRARAVVEDIIINPLGLNFLLMYAEDIPSALPYADLGIVNGNFIISHGLNIDEALHREVLAENYLNVIAVRTEDLGQQFIRDIVDIVYGEEFREAILDEDGSFYHFQMPHNISRIRN